MLKQGLKKACALVSVGLLALLTACGALKPPEECPFTGTADESVFQQSIYKVELVVEKTHVSPESGAPGEYLEPEKTLIFRTQDKLELVFMTKIMTLSGLVCISQAKGGVKIVFTQDWHFSEMTGTGWSDLMRPPGVTVRENRIPLGTFQRGPYVIRIAVDNKLVKNISFTVK
jgi:hypothetical protein